MKKGLKIIGLSLAGLMLIWIFIFGLKTSNNEFSGGLNKIEIKKGQNVWEVARLLEKENVISNKNRFVWYVWRKGLRGDIKAGEYLLSGSLSIDKIIKIITEGDIIEEKNEIKITFPEGWNNKDYEARIKKNELAGDDFKKLIEQVDYFKKKYKYNFLESVPDKKTLEGFLFPDTYFFASDSDAENIIKKMLDNFDKKLNNDLRLEINGQNKSIYSIITMASIIEEEVKSLEDKKIVSGIFWRRMARGQAFQSCATLAYILGENKKQYSYADTKIESPYNTYLYPGLPPGPISNPGLDSILAAIYPTRTNYNYFLSNLETGRTVFSKTLEEHNVNKVKNGL